MGKFTNNFERVQRLKNAGLYGKMTFHELVKWISKNIPEDQQELHKKMAAQELQGKPQTAVYTYFKLAYPDK